MPEKKKLEISNYSGGGSDSDVIGIKGSFAESVGLDIHSKPHILTVNQKLTKNSGATVTGLCKFAVKATDGNSYWFSADDGKIFKRTAAGIYSEVRTNANGACLGAKEFEDYIYYATNDNLGRYGPLSGSATWTDSWQTLNDVSYHPMVVQGLYLVIGNGVDLATVDDTETFTSNGTSAVTFSSFPANQNVRAMRKFGADVLIGTYSLDSNDVAMLVRWDTVSPTYLADPPDLSETSVQAIISHGTYAFVFAGEYGTIYYYDGVSMIPYKQIKGNYTSTAYLKVNSEATCEFQGRSHFGVSNGAGNPALQGVWSLGQRDRNYPMALNLEYLPSTGNSSGIEIGAMLVIDKDIFVAWKDGVNYGVDMIDWANKFSGAYVKFLAVGGSRERSKVFKDFIMTYRNRIVGTDLSLSYYKNYGSTLTSMTLKEKTADNKLVTVQNIPAGVIQPRVDFTVAGNNAPELESLYMTWEEEDTP